MDNWIEQKETNNVPSVRSHNVPNNNFEKRNIFVLLLRIGAFLIKKLNLCLWAQIRHITVSCLLTGKKSAGLIAIF